MFAGGNRAASLLLKSQSTSGARLLVAAPPAAPSLSFRLRVRACQPVPKALCEPLNPAPPVSNMRFGFPATPQSPRLENERVSVTANRIGAKGARFQTVGQFPSQQPFGRNRGPTITRTRFGGTWHKTACAESGA